MPGGLQGPYLRHCACPHQHRSIDTQLYACEAKHNATYSAVLQALLHYITQKEGIIVQAMAPYRGSGGIAPRILNLGAR